MPAFPPPLLPREEEEAAAAFIARPSHSCRFNISRAPSIPPTPACAEASPPGKVIAPNATLWEVDGGYIRPRDTESKYSLAEAMESKTDASRGGLKLDATPPPPILPNVLFDDDDDKGNIS